MAKVRAWRKRRTGCGRSVGRSSATGSHSVLVVALRAGGSRTSRRTCPTPARSAAASCFAAARPVGRRSRRLRASTARSAASPYGRTSSSARGSAVADWFVQNVADAEWWVNEKFGARTMLVPHGSQVGARVHVLEPGTPMTLYHRESEQEGFLVIEGECLLIVEGEERTLRSWDYFHCAPGTTHSFVGVGDGPCMMVTVGARTEGGTILYARDETALRHDAGVEAETDTPAEAYARSRSGRAAAPRGGTRCPGSGGHLDPEPVSLGERRDCGEVDLELVASDDLLHPGLVAGREDRRELAEVAGEPARRDDLEEAQRL